jgi:polyisoprenoid-binding protein YceI
VLARLLLVIPLRPLAVTLLAAATLGACGGAGLPATFASGAASATPSESPAAASEAPSSDAVSGGLSFTVGTGSKAVVRVNEQLADRTLPSDAVLTSSKVTGQFTLLPDGTFAPGSRIVVDLTSLASDNSLRDNTVRRSVLETQRYPQATFVPTKTTGLALPLPATGDRTFGIVGQMTVHGVTKEITFDVICKRTESDLQVAATVTPAFPFATFGMSQPRVFTVLSIKDEIRLEVDLVAKQAD